MKCARCGVTIPPGSQFCLRCGAPVSPVQPGPVLPGPLMGQTQMPGAVQPLAASSTPYPPAVYPAGTLPARKGNPARAVMIALAALLLCLIAATAAVIHQRQAMTSATPVGLQGGSVANAPFTPQNQGGLANANTSTLQGGGVANAPYSPPAGGGLANMQTRPPVGGGLTAQPSIAGPQTAQPQDEVPDEPPATGAVGRALSPNSIVTSSSSTSRASAAIWRSTVRPPCPMSAAASEPVKWPAASTSADAVDGEMFTG